MCPRGRWYQGGRPSRWGSARVGVAHTLHQLLGLEEAFEVLHLPGAGGEEDQRLGDGPPQHALVGALARHAEPLLPILQRTRVSSSDRRHVKAKLALDSGPGGFY